MATTALHGLSRDVTLAVLPRLFTEEVVAELARRNISFGGYSFDQEVLVVVLKNAMMQEYRNLEPGKNQSDDIVDDRNFEFTPDAELAERGQLQCQVLQTYSQTLSVICPSPNINNSLSTTECSDDKDIVTNQESPTKYEAMCPNANASCNNGVIPPSTVEAQSEMASASEDTETVSYATNRQTSYVDNVPSPNRELEDDKTHDDAELYSIDPGLQSVYNRSSSDRHSTGLNTSDSLSAYLRNNRTNQRSDFVKHSRIHNVSYGLGIERENCTPQFHQNETRQGTGTPEVAAVLEPSNTVVATGHDGKASVCMAANRERGSYEIKLDKNIAYIDESNSPVFENEKKNCTKNKSSTCLEPLDVMLFSCKDCDYRTKKKSYLIRHTRIHTGEKPYKCDECGLKMTRKSSLVKHMRKHTGEKPYKCDECSFKTTRKCTLALHMRKHTGEKPFMCGECGFRAARKASMNYHMKKHTGDKRHVCDVCGYSTIRQTDLVVHQRKHTGEKPFVCGDCGYKSAYKANLATHMKRHTTDGIPLSCDQCGFMTTSNSKLVTHQRVHYVDEPCGKVCDD